MKMKIIQINIINYAKKYTKQVLKLKFLMICLLSAFFFPLIKSNITWLCDKLLLNFKGQILYYEFIFNSLSLIVGFIMCHLIIYIFNDVYIWILKYFKLEKNNDKKLNSISSKEVYVFYMQDCEVWARKNNLYENVPENLWEELRIARKGLKINYTNCDIISFKYLLKRQRSIAYFMKINTRVLIFLENNKSNNIFLRCYYKINSILLRCYYKIK